MRTPFMVGWQAGSGRTSLEAAELAERCADPRVLHRVLDGTEIAAQVLHVKESIWQKILQRIARRFNREAFADMQRRISEMESFIGEEFQPLERMDEYLTRAITTRIADTLQRLHNGLAPGARFWPATIFPAWIKAAGFQYFVKQYNQNYITTQARLHAAFFSGNDTGTPPAPGVQKPSRGSLNENQVRAILVNDQHTLAIAGPGSGKTRTLTDRIAFYVLKKGVSPARILVLAYNKAAAAEIEDRLKASFDITGVRIGTFHAIGFSILRQFLGSKGRDLHVEGNQAKVIRDIVATLKGNDTSFQNAYISFFASHRDLEPEPSTLAVSTTKQAIAEMFLHEQQKKYNALDGTLVKSIAERDIANFFITRGIAYAYEPLVTWCDNDKPEKTYHPDFYLPAHDIYLEHWSMPEHGKVPGWFGEKQGTSTGTLTGTYASIRDWKRGQFAKHGKTLWETDHVLWASGQLEATLERYCSEHHVPVRMLSINELLAFLDKFPNDKKVIDDEIASCISSAKVNGYTFDAFRDLVHRKQGSMIPREKAFLDLVIPVFSAYHQHLHASGSIDYDDMINDACKYMELQRANQPPDGVVLPAYSMIMVDEFQDISKQRLALLRELCALHPDARLFCVGDDWQAIYGFSGSSNRYLVDCDRFFPGHQVVKLVHNYRNPKDVIDFGSKVISKSKEKFNPKDLVAVKRQPGDSEPPARGAIPLVLAPIFVKRVDAASEIQFWAVQAGIAHERIKELLAGGAKPGDIMVLSRFNFGYSRLQERCERDPATTPVAIRKDGKVVKAGVRFHSIHGSKGLEAPHVIILNAYEGKYGLPAVSRGWLDPKFLNPDLSDPEDEERRLFFVGITRAKESLTILTWRGQESRFLDAIPSSKDVLKAKMPGDIEGKLIQETERACLLRLDNGFNEGFEFWIPKSQVNALMRLDEKSSVKLDITAWWLRKKLEEFD